MHGDNVLNRWNIMLPMYKYSYVNVIAFIKETCGYHNEHFMTVCIYYFHQ